MNCELRDGRLRVFRTEAERDPIVSRLRRIEGQVRGLIQMTEADRHCLDTVQQASAVTSAMREVALLILSQHLEAGVAHSMLSPERHQEINDEVASVMRAALRLQG